MNQPLYVWLSAIVVGFVVAEARFKWKCRTAAERLYKRIEHGDETHRAWLKDALERFFE